VQNRYSLLDRSSEPVLEYCSGEDMAFIPWNPLEVGQLARPGGVVSQIAERRQAMPAQVALAWLLAHSPAMLPIPGTSRVSHLEENLGAVALDLPPADLAELDHVGEARHPGA